MANYELALTASEIDVALQKAHSPTTSITNSATSDPSLVTSGAVKSAIENISVGSTLTVNSFAAAALETSTDTLTDTDTAIPTSAAVKDYVDTASVNSTPFNSLRLYLLPNTFDQSTTTEVYYGKNTSSTFGSGTSTTVVASTRIPLGYKATQFTYSTDSSNNTVATVFENSISSASATSKGTKTAKGSNLVLNITDIIGSDTNYVSVHLSRDNYNSGSNRRYYGGYFTLVKV